MQQNINDECQNELQNLIQLFNELSSSVAFTNDTSNSLRRSLSLAIYFLQRNDNGASMERARDAFVKAGEIIREMSMKPANVKLLADEQQQLQRDLRRLFAKVVVVIECIDKSTRESSPSPTTPPATTTTSSSSPDSQTPKKKTNWYRVAQRNVNRLAQNQQEQQQEQPQMESNSMQTFTPQQQQTQPTQQQQQQSDPAATKPETSRSKLQRLFQLVRSGVVLGQNSSSNNNNAAKSSTNIQQVKEQPKEHDPATAFAQLQQRLAMVMSNQSLSATGALSESDDITLTQLKTLSLVELLQELSKMQGLGTNTLNNLLRLYQRFSLYENDDIASQIEKYYNSSSEAQQSIFKRLDSQIYSHVNRIIFEAECINQNRVIVNGRRESQIFSPDEILQKYARSLRIDESVQLLLYAKVLAEKFEHTLFHLKKTRGALHSIFMLVNERELDGDTKHGIESLMLLFIGQYRMRIIELNFCFGAITFSTSTNDYSEDRAIESLELMIDCLKQTLDIRRIVSGVDECTSELLHTWLQAAVNKIYMINSEDIRCRLQERSQLKGLFFEATKLLYLGEFVMAECQGLNSRFGAVFNANLSASLTFLDIISVDFRSLFYEDVDRFCTITDQHQISVIKAMKKDKRSDFELSIGLFHRLVPLIVKTFKSLTQWSSKSEPFPVSDKFYAIIQRCIVYQISSRLSAFAIRAMEHDKMTQTYSPAVLYTRSCVAVVHACFDSLQAIAELDVAVLRHNPHNYKSLLDEYMEIVTQILNNFMANMSRGFQRMLEGSADEDSPVHIRTMNDRIKYACLYFNNVNGVYMLSKNILTKFNNTTFIQLPSTLSDISEEESSSVVLNQIELEDALTALDENAPVDVFDLECIKELMSSIQIASNSIALLFAQFIYFHSEQKLMALFKQFDKNLLDDLLTSLDRFFMITSDFLYIEQLHEVLKHLYVIFVYKLIDILLNPNQQNNPYISIPLSLFSSKSAATLEETNRTIIQQCIKPLKDLFHANGEGLDASFLTQYSRQLEILLDIFYDPTDVLIELYKKLTDVERLYNSTPDMDNSESDADTVSEISVASTDSSRSSTGSCLILLQTIQQRLAKQQLNPNELIKPEYILLLLGTRKKDREARKFVKKNKGS